LDFNVNIYAEFLATLAQAFLLLNIYPDLLYFVYPLALYKRSFHTLFRKVFFCLKEMSKNKKTSRNKVLRGFFEYL